MSLQIPRDPARHDQIADAEAGIWTLVAAAQATRPQRERHLAACSVADANHRMLG